MNTVGRGVVDIMLEDASIGHREGGEHKAQKDAGHRVEIDLVLSKEGIDNH